MSHRVAYTKDQVIAWLHHRFPKIDWTEIEGQLPCIVWRSRWNSLADKLGLPYTRKYLQNLDSLGKGPANIGIDGGRYE